MMERRRELTLDAFTTLLSDISLTQEDIDYLISELSIEDKIATNFENFVSKEDLLEMLKRKI